MTMSRYEAMQFIRTAHDNCIVLARGKYPSYTKASPAVDFELKGRSVLGKAHISTNRVSYNLAYIMLDPVKFLSTVAHEVAHIVGYATGLGKGHSLGWQRIDLSLGGNGKRCSNSGKDEDGNHLVAKARRTSQYLYLDSRGGESWVGPTHHSRLQAGGYTAKKRTRFGGVVLNTCTNYSLRTPTGAKIVKDGFQNKTRMAA